MTADRFGPSSSGEFTAVASMRPSPPNGEATELSAAAASGALSSGLPRSGPAASGPSGSDQPAPPEADRRRPARSESRWRPQFPPQHGAWAFLIVPVLVGMAVAGSTGLAWLFLIALLCSYPVGYYGGRALTARVRRGAWTRLARRELSRATPWAVLLAVLGLPLVVLRPWLAVVAVGLAALWGFGLWVADRRGERSMANGLVLVAQAVVAVPTTVAIVAGPAALTGSLDAETWTATALVAGYLIGSVIHVKSLLREAGNVAWRRADVGWHVALALVAVLASPWWLIGFVPALVRAVVAHPGSRPALIGGIESIVAVLVVVAAVLAV